MRNKSEYGNYLRIELILNSVNILEKMKIFLREYIECSRKTIDHSKIK